MGKRSTILGIVCAVACAPSARAGAPDCSSDGITNASSNGQSWVVDGGQINFSGATLFVDFFRSRSATNDATPADYDGDGEFGFAPPPNGFPISGNFVDQLAENYTPGGGLDNFWSFSYRSVGSVEGFGEFVDSQLCGTIPQNFASEAGIFNGFEFSTGDTINWTGPFANSSGIPLSQCQIHGSLTDVPAAWAVTVAGLPKWDRDPTEPGYGLNFLESSDGTVPTLEFLDRACTTNSLNVNTGNPDSGTIFDFGAAFGPVVPVANHGSGARDLKFSELQYHFATGRFSNGINLIAVTRDTGSGTHNAWMNSLDIDPSWGRGDNIGSRNSLSAADLLGPDFQQSNKGGSSRVEGAAQNNRLALGYTGLAGGSRAARDAFRGFYEVGNTCKDLDEDGNPLVDCDTVGFACAAGPIGSNGVPIDAASPNNGYVRPTINTVLDNCDPECGYQIGGLVSFSLVGDHNANRPLGDPKRTQNPQVENQQAANYINNIADSIDLFTGDVFGGTCLLTGLCSTTGFVCSNSLDCTGGANDVCESISCGVDNDCTSLKLCSTTGFMCNSNGDCAGGAFDVCANVAGVSGDICALSANSPGQFLATAFFLPAGQDCNQSFTKPLTFNPGGLNQDLQDFIRANNGLDWFQDQFNTVGGDTPPFGAVSIAGQVPRRTAGPVYTDGQGAATSTYIYWNGASYVLTSTGTNLSRRNRLTGDFNDDGVRNIDDAKELVEAFWTPRAWQQTAAGMGITGPVCPETAAAQAAFATQPGGFDFCLGKTNVNNVTIISGMSANNGIPEVMGDFQGDGNFTKEDLRYFADGLATSNGFLNRKKGAIAIDDALVSVGAAFPWADTNGSLTAGNTSGFALEPVHAAPAPISGFLATGAAYANGDFRCDVAGDHPVAGAQPLGWDGSCDAIDIDYCCQFVRQGYTWSDIDDAVFMDLSCDMDGDVDVTTNDIAEMVVTILKTSFGDANLDGMVDGSDVAIVQATIAAGAGGCNGAGDCGWSDGDFDCDGDVDGADLAQASGVPVAGDCDGDGDLTPADYDVSFAACHSGPSGGLGAGCECNDRDMDGDVDLADFAELQITNVP